MKRVLLIKLTSLGDLIHALPALSDAKSARPELEFDWVIDENFQEIAAWHPAVKGVITTNHRKWREALAHPSTLGSISRLVAEIRAVEYYLVIDGQGNFKTALLSMFTKGPRAGFDRHSVREWIAHLAYQRRFAARFPDPKRAVRRAESRSAQGVPGFRPQRQLEDEALARSALGRAPEEDGSGRIQGAVALGKQCGGGESEAPCRPPRGSGPAQAHAFRNGLCARESEGLCLHGHGAQPLGRGAERAFDHPLRIDRLRAHRGIRLLAGAPAVRSSLLSLPEKDLPLHPRGQSVPAANHAGQGLHGVIAPGRPATRIQSQATPSLTGIRLGPKAFLNSSKRPAIAPPHSLHRPSSVTR